MHLAARNDHDNTMKLFFKKRTVVGQETGLSVAKDTPKVLQHTDPKAVIQAVRNACKSGKARTRELGAVGMEIGRRRLLYGESALKICKVKSHIGIARNEEAGEAGAAKDSSGQITEWGIREDMKRSQTNSRTETGTLCIAKWNSRAATTCAQLLANKGNLGSWRHKIGKAASPICRFCKGAGEVGGHITFECPHWSGWRVKSQVEGTLRRWVPRKDLELAVGVDIREDGECIDNVQNIFLTGRPP